MRTQDNDISETEKELLDILAEIIALEILNYLKKQEDDNERK